MSLLAATDLSTRSAAALRFGEQLAVELDTDLTIIHVAPESRPDVAKDAANALETFVREYLERPAGHTLDVIVGNPVDELVKAGDDYDLILCGSTGASLHDEIFLGSTASRLLRRASTPVCVVPPAIGAEFGTIVVPVAFDRASRTGLQLAARIAKATSAEVCLLHALDIQTPAYADPPTDEDVSRLVEEARDRLETWADEEGISELAASFEISREEPAEAIRAMVATCDADLVVMGTHGRGDQSIYFLGSVAERVVRQPPCAVITTHPVEPDETYARE